MTRQGPFRDGIGRRATALQTLVVAAPARVPAAANEYVDRGESTPEPRRELNAMTDFGLLRVDGITPRVHPNGGRPRGR